MERRREPSYALYSFAATCSDMWWMEPVEGEEQARFMGKGRQREGKGKARQGKARQSRAEPSKGKGKESHSSIHLHKCPQTTFSGAGVGGGGDVGVGVGGRILLRLVLNVLLALQESHPHSSLAGWGGVGGENLQAPTD